MNHDVQHLRHPEIAQLSNIFSLYLLYDAAHWVCLAAARRGIIVV